MDLNALKVAGLVARHGSFAAVARVTDQDPSAISRIIATLEVQLGLRLFQRTTRRLSITQEGSLYLSHVIPLLEEFDRAHEEALQNRSTPSGILRVTASVAFGHECIAPLLPAYSDRFPDITLELILTDSNLDLVQNGIDLAVRLTPAPEGDLISTRLVQTSYRVVAAPSFLQRNGAPKTPEELSRLNCLRTTLPDYRTRWIFQQRYGDVQSEVTVNGNLLISNPLALRRAAQDGLGPALLADWMVRDSLASGELLDLFPDHNVTATRFDTAAYALYPSRAYLPVKVRATIDFLRRALTSHHPEGSTA